MADEALTLQNDPQEAIEKINHHKHNGELGNSIDTDGIKNNAVTNDKLAPEAVTADKIKNKAVSPDKLTQELIDIINAGGSGGANAPGYYRRDVPFVQSEKTKITTPGRLWLNIGTGGYALQSPLTYDINNYETWDTKATAWQSAAAYEVDDCIVPITPNGYIYRCLTAGISSELTPEFPTTLGQTYNDGNVVWICQLDLTVAANRKGKDFYIYACQPTTSIVPIIVISDNSTIPLNYSPVNSRKIGGFHCLCADIGTISGHPLTGYVAGDILPASVWDLSHRPVSAPEGMVYDSGTDKWIDIYLSSIQNGQLASIYNGVTADGTSAEKFHWYKGSQWMSRIKKDLLTQREFVSASLGSNQGTNILGSADPNTTGGHKDTANRRMISNIGCEDMCGALWQWGSEAGGPYSAASYANAFDGNDTGVGGQHYNTPDRALLGGSWGAAAYCGSRCSHWNFGPLYLAADFGLRGRAEPLRGT